MIGLALAAVVAAGPGTSWYVGDLDPGRLGALGARDAVVATAAGGPASTTVLDFGDPTGAPGDTELPGGLGTSTATQTLAAVTAYARGWAAMPGHPQLVLVVGTSNFGHHLDVAHGTAWGQLVGEAAAATPGVDVRGGVDAEMDYNPAAPTRAFVRAYLAATDRPFVDFGDCACTPGQALPKGWTISDRVAVAAAGSLLPQVYRTSGIDAVRFGHLDAEAASIRGKHLEILGALTQTRACAGPPARACTGTDTAPAVAQAALAKALGRAVPAGSDIGYLLPPPPPVRRPGRALLVPAFELLGVLGVLTVLAVGAAVLLRRRRPRWLSR